MDRDGINASLWQDVSYESKSIEKRSDEYDVVIVGGGMTGVVTALSLQKSGKKCLLVEAHNLGYGTTGGTTAHLNTLLDTPYTTIENNFGLEGSRIVAAAAKEAIDTIARYIKNYRIHCEFERTPAYLFSEDEKETKELLKILEATQRAGVVVSVSKELPIATHFDKILKIEAQAKFHPLKYLLALAIGFENAGGHILSGCTVEEVKEDDGLLEIQTSLGIIRAAKIVFATHIPIGINILHMRCAPWRSYAMAVKLKDVQYPNGLIYDMKDPYHYYRSQTIDGEPYLIAGGKDHKTGENENTEQPFLQLRAHIEKIFNVSEITHQWSSQYFESADGIPYIGYLPGHNENYLVATGYGGNGMIYSHVAASEITSLINSGESLHNNLFSPSRIKPVAGFKNFITHNSDVVKHFVGKIFPSEKITAVADLASGEGRVVTIDGSDVALSKDSHGELHAVSPVCTHMKCHVTWNTTEQSWDCPCHGSRYSPDGKVITGPATHELELVELAKANGHVVHPNSEL
jgi:glycine/D-amino acid oxidase-like deaminating enzyme/Rieske Fe-S protein